MFKKLCSIVLAVMIMLTVLPIPAAISKAAGSTDFLIENGVLVSYTGTDADLVIPGDLGITSIGVNAFASCFGLISVTIPEGVTSLERGAFYYCNNLTSVMLPDSLTSIGESAFSLCQSLTSITIPEGVTSIGAAAFRNCVSLTEIELPASLNQIGNGAFDTCTNLSDLYFFGNAPAMGYGVFNYAAADLNIYYYYNVSGFSDIWYGYETTPFMVVDSEAVSAFITRLYEKVLSRTAGETEIAYYMDALIGNDTENAYMTGADVGYGFIFSPEFINKNLSNSDFLEVLYTTFMNRPSDPDGKAYWLHMLDNGVSREYVFKGFVESSEYTNICNSCGIDNGEIVLTEAVNSNPNLTMFVYRLYAMALGRPAETEGLEFHTSEILSGNTSPIDAAQNFIFSPEFENKNLSNEDYVKVLYRTFMGREFDQGGLEYHLNRITNGVSREEILNGFAYSPEFIGIMDSFGL